jgi:hypothetical protein
MRRVDAGTYLQVAGAVGELAGLATVAFGISETRASFTDQPSLAHRARERIRRAVDRLMKRPQTVTVGTVAGSVSFGGGRVRATVGFGPWDDVQLAERIERLKHAIENHEQQLYALDKRIDEEEAARTEALRRIEQQAEEVNREMRDLIREAAAGGLRLETIGVVLFAAGVIFGTWGSLIA